ncbi:acylglycerol lipase [Monocercomonoides exilis]|uniref:acylglycerol lipase n=1 Tax=Monocercomonoides exilis TaxID=2049356 RepID=UPI003559A00F|nr:acylglycerol lipase [Monocercomonoides exilis]|eukprot:MONOS_8674.1-p1 / transcript=MONOS_8674.1 / gene=MONOS_8674 / organism=Monocercomonoides_exilis_PA203 / gene_product=acylglycerol lipase [EC:3.1.1.23] / transcript_product=acylglycerol lipase [EC:3.1.1.23] / location=Mono_scaffold00333:49502-51482(-) / protein_length=312 / sequence_SO=supercontig / SO=protein_coding / is_pseudo=false
MASSSSFTENIETAKPYEISSEGSIELKQEIFPFKDLKLMSYSYRAPAPKGIIFFSHGLMEHTRAEQVTIDMFGRNRFSVFALDLPGHGLSTTGDPSGEIPDFMKAIDAWVDYINDISSEQFHKPVPKFWFGHSLGATVGILVSRRTKNILRGSILSAPTVYVNVNWFALTAITPLSWMFPSMAVQKLDRTALAHDQSVKARAEADPLCGQKPVTARTGRQIKLATDEIQNHFDQDDYPYLLLHGEADTITPKKNSELFFAKSTSKDKKLHIFPGCYHEIHNEPCRDECYKLILDWLTPRLEIITEPSHAV